MRPQASRSRGGTWRSEREPRGANLLTRSLKAGVSVQSTSKDDFFMFPVLRLDRNNLCSWHSEVVTLLRTWSPSLSRKRAGNAWVGISAPPVTTLVTSGPHFPQLENGDNCPTTPWIVANTRHVLRARPEIESVLDPCHWFLFLLMRCSQLLSLNLVYALSLKNVCYGSNVFHPLQAFPSRPLMHCTQQLNLYLTKGGIRIRWRLAVQNSITRCPGKLGTEIVLCCSGS